MRQEYGIHPWDLPRYTATELHALVRDMTERDRQARETGT